jgi:L-seryl-tRNA(Ser) seleniumtransferase
VEALSIAFRSLAVPVIGHIKDGALILDLRCLEDEAAFLDQLASLEGGREAGDAP